MGIHPGLPKGYQNSLKINQTIIKKIIDLSIDFDIDFHEKYGGRDEGQVKAKLSTLKEGFFLLHTPRILGVVKSQLSRH